MAKKTIKLAGITSGDAIEVDSKPVYKLTDDDVSAKKATAAGYGTFAWIAADASDTKFVADAALAGEISLAIGSGTIVSADFSKASAGIKFTGDASVTAFTGGAGNDTLIGDDATTSINAGAGNDLVSLAASATQTTVTLGAGADTLDISAVTATGNNKVFDYNYFEGDVIKVANGDSVTLNADGAATVGPATAASKVAADKVAIQDNWYGVKTNNGTADVDYFTAVNNNNLTVSKDLSNSVIANVVDASGAKNASITLGHKDDTVTLSTVSGVDTIKVGKSAGSNTLTNFNATEDIIAIDGVKMSDIKFDTTGANASIVYAASTLEAGISKNGKGSLNFNDGSKTHKLAYDLAGNSSLDYKTYSDADWVLGTAGAAGTTLEVGATTHLHDMSKYKNITNISVSTDAKLDAPISLTGAINEANKIDATNAKVGTAIWGFSSGNDSITLGSGQDTVWFGAGDGNDSITGFKYGTASDSDVLYLKDTKTLKDVNAAYDGTGNKAQFTVGSAVATVDKNSVTNSSDVAQIQLADEKTYKVAGEYTSANTVTINTDDIDGLDYYAFAGDKTAKAVTITGSKDWIFHSLYTDFYTTGANVATVDASNATGKVTLAAAASIHGGKGTSNIWTYQANSSASVTGGDGTDIIWFAENADKDVHVNSFDTDKDIVKFATAQSLKEIAEGYTFKSGAASQATITGATNTDSQLILDKNGTINLVDANDKAYKALVMNTVAGGTTGEFSTDVNIYAGMTTLNAGGSVEGTVSLRLGKESRGLSSDTYFIDDSVTKFDGSKSNATFWVAGNANKSNTIIGGMTENYLYGGGASADTLQGSVLAKDTFYFGTGDGVDEISSGVDTKDTIALWNISDADIANVKVSIDTEKNTVSVSFKDSSTLNITDANAVSALKNGLTFTSASQTAYTYNSETKTLVKKA